MAMNQTRARDLGGAPSNTEYGPHVRQDSDISLQPDSDISLQPQAPPSSQIDPTPSVSVVASIESEDTHENKLSWWRAGIRFAGTPIRKLARGVNSFTALFRAVRASDVQSAKLMQRPKTSLSDEEIKLLVTNAADSVKLATRAASLHPYMFRAIAAVPAAAAGGAAVAVVSVLTVGVPVLWASVLGAGLVATFVLAKGKSRYVNRLADLKALPQTQSRRMQVELTAIESPAAAALLMQLLEELEARDTSS